MNDEKKYKAKGEYIKGRKDGKPIEGTILASSEDGCLIKTPDGDQIEISWRCVFD
jgi:hypothetical protein